MQKGGYREQTGLLDFTNFHRNSQFSLIPSAGPSKPSRFKKRQKRIDENPGAIFSLPFYLHAGVRLHCYKRVPVIDWSDVAGSNGPRLFLRGASREGNFWDMVHVTYNSQPRSLARQRGIKKKEKKRNVGEEREKARKPGSICSYRRNGQVTSLGTSRPATKTISLALSLLSPEPFPASMST